MLLKVFAVSTCLFEYLGVTPNSDHFIDTPTAPFVGNYRELVQVQSPWSYRLKVL
jgi:hypothetical protein